MQVEKTPRLFFYHLRVPVPKFLRDLLNTCIIDGLGYLESGSYLAQTCVSHERTYGISLLSNNHGMNDEDLCSRGGIPGRLDGSEKLSSALRSALRPSQAWLVL